MALRGAGLLVASQYRLVRQIGRGGMGTVWEARDEFLDRTVAVKEFMIFAERTGAEHAALVRRSIREARSAARLDHPNVITVHNIVEFDGYPWIVMEYIRGESLAQVIASRGPLPPSQAAEIGLQILQALDAAHMAGVVHRDVKPANILLEGRRAILTDFGIAALAGDATITRIGTILGTPAFMAPEQARGFEATSASDLWSLGVTLYNAIEGDLPFRASNQLAVLAAVMTEDPIPARNLGGLPPLVDGLLHKDPGARPSAGEAQRMLRQIMNPSQPVTAQLSPMRPIHSKDHRPVTRPLVVRAVPAATLRGHHGSIRVVAFSPGGQVLVTGGADSTICVWDATTYEQVVTLDGHEDYVNAVAFSPDGGLLATAGDDRSIQLWDTADWEHADELMAHTAAINALTVDPRDDTLISAGEDGTVRLWDLVSRTEIGDIPAGIDLPTAAAISGDGTRFAVAGVDTDVQLWNLAEGVHRANLPIRDANALTFTADGATLVTGGDHGVVQLWNADTGSEQGALPAPTGHVMALAAGPDGNALATGSDDGTIQLWHQLTRRYGPAIAAHSSDIRALAFSPDGQVLATCGDDATTRLWNTTRKL